MKKTKIMICALIALSAGLATIPDSLLHATEVNKQTLETKSLTGDNDRAMNETMKKGMEYNVIADPAKSDWVQYLNEQWMERANQFEWTDTSGVKDISKWEIEDSADKVKSKGGVAYKENEGKLEKVIDDPWVMPILNGTTYDVYSGQQLKYALMMSSKDASDEAYMKPKGFTINLKVNLDLQGYQYAWSENNQAVTYDRAYRKNTTSEYTEFTFNGEEHTIYNIGCNERSFIGRLANNCNISNIDFVSAKLAREKADANADNFGLFMETNVPNTSDINKQTVISNLSVEKSLIFHGGGDTGYVSPIGAVYDTDISDYYTTDNGLYAGHLLHVGGATGRMDYSSLKSSFSVDSTVISTYKHSGGFIACSDGAIKVEDCFTNNTVYGDEDTGVFIGATTNINTRPDLPGCEFLRSYASGSVEGIKNLGGFMGAVDTEAYKIYDFPVFPLSFKDCYTTSIVGMKAGGTNLGGFIGNIPVDKNVPKIAFENCYAAGEVGSIDTDVSIDRSGFKTVGGFVGNYVPMSPDDISFTNCYYDKQTTGMRGWETGPTRDTGYNMVTGKDDVPGINDISGIKGVLTSDSEKSGAGLASNPKANPENHGFTGLGDGTASIDGATMNLWIYDANLGGEVSGKHNCEYPQLSVFAQAGITEWGHHADMVKAFSLASAATIHQQVWDKCINPKHNTLSAATYDTVRDLTLRMTMTSYINHDDSYGEVGVDWSYNNTKTSLYGKENVPVIGFFKKAYNEIHDRDYFTADQFAPGIEWLTVNISVNGAVGNRRLRVVPTTNIEAGEDQLNLFSGEKYNHALDVRFAKSTGPRMNVDEKDITQGVFPDFPIAAGDSRLNTLQHTMIKNPDGSYYVDPNFNVVPASFKEDDDKLVQVPSNFMSGATATMPDNHPNTYLSTKLYKLPDILPSDSDDIDVRILLKDSTEIDLSDSVNSKWADKLNGKAAFEEGDSGRYIIQYVWALDDARYITNFKMLLIQGKEHKVNVYVRDSKKDLNATSLKLYTKAYNDTAPTLSDNDFTKKTVSSLSEAKINDGSSVLFAAKKKAGETEVITKIAMDIYTADGIVHREIKNPTIGSVFEFPMTYFYGSYDEGGIYYVKQFTTTKKYVLSYNEEQEYYFVKLDNTFTKEMSNGQILTRDDLNNDIDITVTIQPSSIIDPVDPVEPVEPVDPVEPVEPVDPDAGKPIDKVIDGDVNTGEDADRLFLSICGISASFVIFLIFIVLRCKKSIHR